MNWNGMEWNRIGILSFRGRSMDEIGITYQTTDVMRFKSHRYPPSPHTNLIELDKLACNLCIRHKLKFKIIIWVLSSFDSFWFDFIWFFFSLIHSLRFVGVFLRHFSTLILSKQWNHQRNYLSHHDQSSVYTVYKHPHRLNKSKSKSNMKIILIDDWTLEMESKKSPYRYIPICVCAEKTVEESLPLAVSNASNGRNWVRTKIEHGRVCDVCAGDFSEKSLKKNPIFNSFKSRFQKLQWMWNELSVCGGGQSQKKAKNEMCVWEREREYDDWIAHSNNELRALRRKSFVLGTPRQAGRHADTSHSFHFWCSANSWAAWKYGCAMHCKKYSNAMPSRHEVAGRRAEEFVTAALARREHESTKFEPTKKSAHQ